MGQDRGVVVGVSANKALTARQKASAALIDRAAREERIKTVALEAAELAAGVEESAEQQRVAAATVHQAELARIEREHSAAVRRVAPKLAAAVRKLAAEKLGRPDIAELLGMSSTDIAVLLKPTPTRPSIDGGRGQPAGEETANTAPSN